jgi:density-regulated protein
MRYAILEIEKGVEGIQIEEKPEEKKNDRSLVKDKSAQLEAKLEKENRKKMESHVIIKRVERTKRKCVTTIHGLEVFGKKRGRVLKWGEENYF